MTNRNRKRRQKRAQKQALKKEKMEGLVTEPIKEQVQERKGKMIIANVVTIIISCLALIVSIISLWSQSQYAELEYEYKLDPEVTTDGMMGVKIQVLRNGGRKLSASMSEFKIRILQKNNLQSAYLIHANNEVEKLEIDEIEQTLESEMGNQIKFDEPDMVIDDISYNYKFLFLKGMDGGYELFLLYMKAGRDRFGFEEVSEAELWEMEKSHPGEEEYIGEKRMAKKYIEVLEGCKKYMY